MDYQDVPQEVLDLSVRASKAANAEYWACDIAVSTKDEYTILECATAFAAFPYIRDWIGQYLMWLLAPQSFGKPHFVHKNWEELGKIDASLLRTMRHITFGQASNSTDTGEYAPADEQYSLLKTDHMQGEEWPSEAWNFQDMHHQGEGNPYMDQEPMVDCHHEDLHHQDQAKHLLDSGIEDCSNVTVMGKTDTERKTDVACETDTEIEATPECEIESVLAYEPEQLVAFFNSVKGIGQSLAQEIVATLGVTGALYALEHEPQQLMAFRNLKQKKN